MGSGQFALNRAFPRGLWRDKGGMLKRMGSGAKAMPTNHTVAQGEHLSRIAFNYGFTDYKKIWNDPANADLQQLRKDPNVLYPGDELVIPDKETREETRPTEALHKFKLHLSTLNLRLVLKDFENKPIAKAKCRLDVEASSDDLTTGGDGKIERIILPVDENGRLVVAEKEIDLPIRIGHLDPADTPTGQKGRLNNLGYDAGPLEVEDDLRFRSAVEEFQCDNKLTVDGVIGPQTQGKLKDVHGV
jgi:hypothetical protein